MSALILSIRRFWAKGGRDKVEKAWYSVYVCLYTGLSTYKNNNNNKLYFHSHKKFQLQQNSISHKQSWTETEKHIVKDGNLRGTQQLSPLKYVGNTFYAVQSFLFCALEMHSKRQYKIVIV